MSQRTKCNHYSLADYSNHTQQELSAICRQRQLGDMGHKHELIQRLVYEDLDDMQRHLFGKDWHTDHPPFKKEAEEIRECTMKGAYQFYVEKVKYLRERMEEKEGK
jgi:hypothetical protein